MKNTTSYVLRMSLGLAGYAAGLVAMNALYQPHAPWRCALLLLPVLPLLYTAATIIRGVSRLDELQRKIVSDAMAFSGVATGFTCFCYLFLRDAGAPEFHGEWAFYLMWFYYGVGSLLSARRFV